MLARAVDVAGAGFGRQPSSRSVAPPSADTTTIGPRQSALPAGSPPAAPRE
jgi:hypothetical protein